MYMRFTVSPSLFVLIQMKTGARSPGGERFEAIILSLVLQMYLEQFTRLSTC